HRTSTAMRQEPLTAGQALAPARVTGASAGHWHWHSRGPLAPALIPCACALCPVPGSGHCSLAPARSWRGRGLEAALFRLLSARKPGFQVLRLEASLFLHRPQLAQGTSSPPAEPAAPATADTPTPTTPARCSRAARWLC